MNTTAIIIEILIVGIMSTAWIVLAILAILGYTWVNPLLNRLKDWEAIVSLSFLSFVYVVGIGMDRFADILSVLLNPKDVLLKFKWIKSTAEVAHSDRRMSLLYSEKKAADFLEHIRSRIRIIRATMINFPLVTISLICFLYYQTSYTSWKLFLGIIGVCILFLCFFFVSLGVLEASYYKRLEQACESEKVSKN